MALACPRVIYNLGTVSSIDFHRSSLTVLLLLLVRHLQLLLLTYDYLATRLAV